MARDEGDVQYWLPSNSDHVRSKRRRGHRKPVRASALSLFAADGCLSKLVHHIPETSFEFRLFGCERIPSVPTRFEAKLGAQNCTPIPLQWYWLSMMDATRLGLENWQSGLDYALAMPDVIVGSLRHNTELQRVQPSERRWPQRCPDGVGSLWPWSPPTAVLLRPSPSKGDLLRKHRGR